MSYSLWLCPPLLQEKQLARAKSQRDLLGDAVIPPHPPTTGAATTMGSQMTSLAGSKNINKPQIKSHYSSFFPLKSSGGTWARGRSSIWKEMCPDKVSPSLWTSSQPVISHNISRAP